MTDTPTEPRRRRGGRRERPTGPAAPGQRPWQLYRRTIEPTKVVSDDELESIHLASLEVLRDTGMDFLHPHALKLWVEAGAEVDGERVRFGEVPGNLANVDGGSRYLDLVQRMRGLAAREADEILSLIHI